MKDHNKDELNQNIPDADSFLPLDAVLGEEEAFNSPEKPPRHRVFLCNDVQQGYTGRLIGRINPDSGVHYLWKTPKDAPLNTQCAWMGQSREEAMNGLAEWPLCGWWEGDKPFFAEQAGNTVIFSDVERYDEESLYSRNGTLVARDALAKKNVVLVGAGSVGSQVAPLLARAGVQNFLLVDCDTVELHNLSRTFDRSMLGMYKTHAVRDTLLRINPDVNVQTLEVRCENADHAFYDQLHPGNTLIIGAADNRTSDEWLCNLAASVPVDFMSCGFWDNAALCENFIYRAGSNDHTYGCLLEQSVVEDARLQHNNNYTTNDGKQRKVNAGLAINVQMGNSISAQLALDMLLRNEKDYTPQILPCLSTQMLYFVCTKDARLAGEQIARWAPSPLWAHCCELQPSAKCRCNAYQGKQGAGT